MLRWPTCTYFGSRTISSANRTTSSGIVAEKSSVWRTRGQRRDDAPDVGPEAHVHHAVGFVEHEQLDAAEVGVLLPHVIDQPARRGDDDVDAGLERALLHAHLDAAVDGGARDGRVIREAVDLVFDLHGELARRREHQHAALGRRSRPAVDCGVGPRIALSSRCSIGTTNAQVLPVPVSAHAMRSRAGERERNDRALNRPRFLEPEIADAFEQARVEAERRERRPASCRTASARAPELR